MTQFPHSAIFRAAVAGLFVPFVATGHALPSDTLRRTLREATVSTDRLPVSVAYATPVQALDTAAFRRRGVTDMADALRRFAGVNLRDYGGAG